MSNPLLHPTPEAPRLALRPREAAKALGISERTLWAFMKSGDVRCVRIGRSVRYAVSDLEAFLAQRADGGAA